MQRILFGLALALAFVLAPSAVSNDARADSSLHAFAVGGGSSTCADPSCFTAYEHFAFSAHCQLPTPPGFPITCDTGTTNQPTGHVVLRFTPGPSMSTQYIEISGPVTCLTTYPYGAKGGLAIITFAVTHSNVQNSLPYETLWAIDDGPGGTYDFIGPASPVPTADDCATYQTGSLLPQPVTQGDVTVALQSPMMGANLSGTWWQTDTNGNLYVLNNGTWTLVQ
jgi:hypothetical protein